ncbi:MAG: hypothetical protein KAR39_05250 [Thermoplasmata archaeon]|nr:hypothetical protein [Thermoplasmata archaeon]
MLTRNEGKGKLIFKDSQKWGRLLPPTTFVMGVFITCVGLFAISNFPPTLKGVALSSIVMFMGISLAIVGVLTTSVALDARPLAIYENGLEIPVRPFRWMLKGRSHFIAFNDISNIKRRANDGRECYLINTKSGELLTVSDGTVIDTPELRRLLGESSKKVQYEENND